MTHLTGVDASTPPHESDVIMQGISPAPLLSHPQLTRLPEGIIRSILVFAGVPSARRINVNHGKLIGSPQSDREEWWFGGDSRAYEISGFWSILYTCKALYKIATSILYGENHIVIHWRNGCTLSGLLNLSSHALGSIQKLLIILNSSYAVVDTSQVKSSDISKHPLDEPLARDSPDFATLLRQWQELVHRMTTDLKRDVVWLDLVADCADEASAALIVDPLTALPRLRHCFVRLSRQPDERLQALTRRTALSLVGKPPKPRHGHFRYLDLPTELRLYILKHTDLVTPAKEVEWNPGEKYHVRSLGQHVCKACQCYSCPGGTHPKTLHWFMWNVCPRHPAVFCSRHCSAFEASYRNFYSPISATCLCWQKPDYLFLVSRAFLDDARSVFYSQNRFVVKPAGDLMQAAESCGARSETSRFLREAVPSSSLADLRSLEIVFPFFETDAVFSRVGDSARADLTCTVQTVKPQLNLHALTVSIHIADYTTWRDSDKQIWAYAWTPAEETERIMTDHVEALRCFSPLADAGFSKFFVMLHRPWRWWQFISSEDAEWRDLKTSAYSKEQAADLAKEIERSVMGPGYDSDKVGKRRLKRSMWKKRIDTTRPER